MAAVDGHHAEAQPLGVQGGAGVLFDRLQDLLLRHGADLVPEGADAVRRAVERGAEGGGIVGAVAGVQDLDAGDGAVPGDAVRNVRQLLILIVVPQIDLHSAGPAVLVGTGVPDADAGGAADGLAFIIGAAVPLRLDGDARGRVEDAVPEELTAQNDGLEQMGVSEI